MVRDITTAHPAVFPIGLVSEYVTAMTNQGDIIVEPFTGSGTTMVACEALNRVCYGMELSPKYCALILQRLSELGLKPALSDKT